MEIRLFDKETDREQLRAFNTKIFGAAQIPRKALKNSHINPYSHAEQVTAIAIHEGTIVGHLTSTPYALWVAGKEQLAYWLSGFHVLTEARGMGVGKSLIACLNNALPISSAVVVAEQSLRAFKANGWVWPGSISDHLHIANPKLFFSIITIERIERFLPKWSITSANILLKLIRAPLGCGVKLFHKLLGVRQQIKKGAGSGCEKVDEFGPEIDRLWDKSKNHFELTHVRNAKNLNWQFPTDCGWNKFVCHAANKHAALGWGLYTVKRYADGGPLDGLLALNIIDMFWDVDDPSILPKLIQHVLYLGYSQKVDIIMMSGNLTEWNRVLRKAAFMKIPPTVFVGFSDRQIADSRIEALFSHSYITRGYADAAGGLGP